jgi:hypothetical protein
MREMITGRSRYSPAQIQDYAHRQFNPDVYVTVLKNLFSELASSTRGPDQPH